MSAESRLARTRALKLHATIVRHVGRCEACGSPWNLECAHVVTRARSATATDLDNAFCLCRVCHAHFTDHPFDWTDWVVRQMGQNRYDELHRRSLAPVKADEQFWLERYAALERDYRATS